VLTLYKTERISEDASNRLGIIFKDTDLFARNLSEVLIQEKLHKCDINYYVVRTDFHNCTHSN
jgi:hypothetical protein